MFNREVSIDLVNQYLFTQVVLKREQQQASLDRERIITHNLLLHAMLSQLTSFPKGLLEEFYYAIEQQDLELILSLRNRITRFSRRILKKG
jgi:hypothetical protein